MTVFVTNTVIFYFAPVFYNKYISKGTAAFEAEILYGIYME